MPLYGFINYSLSNITFSDNNNNTNLSNTKHKDFFFAKHGSDVMYVGHALHA